jgi:hypothetical protein
MSGSTSGQSGVGAQGDDPRPGGSTSGAARHDSRLADREAIEGREDDTLGAATEEEMLRAGARSTPPMGDVRSDAGAGAGPGNGEPL